MGKVCNVAAPISSVNGIAINRTKPCNFTNFENKESRNIEYIVYHYTGNTKDTASANANYFMGANRDASAHYFVDDDNIYQSVDLNDIAWHCGASTYYHANCRNYNSIGIEMCCTAGNYKVGAEALENAVQLGVALCKYLGITDVDKYIVRHYDVSHKKCPAQMAGENNAEWKSFKNRIKAGLNSVVETPANLQFKVGDIVNFVGKTHYKSSSALTGSACKAGQAKITAISNGSKHPYHVIRTNKDDCTVYGWVNAADIKAIQSENAGFNVGDVINFVGTKHYASSAALVGSNCKAGEAKITVIAKDAKHPYHVVATKGSNSTVYGWVNATDIKKKECPSVVDTKIDTVKEVQTWLNKSYSAGLVVDGIYGANTKAALVKVLQKAVKVSADGIYGPNTNYAVSNLSSGSYGDAVKALQGLLVCNGYTGAYVDGSYGAATVSAVKSYQQKMGLVADGIAGKATFSALCK